MRRGVLVAVVWAFPFAGVCADEVEAPDDAYLPGEQHAYYGSVNPWDRRFFERHTKTTYGRRGQRQVLDIQEGKIAETIAYCQELLDQNAEDAESLFSLAIAYCQLGRLDESLETVHRALAAGLPLERFAAGPRSLLRPLYGQPEYQRLVADRGTRLLHGPLLGAVSDTRASFWVRTAEESKVEVRIVPAHAAGQSAIVASATTKQASDYTGVVGADGLEPSTEYAYSVTVDDQPISLDWPTVFRTYPRPGKSSRFQVGFGGGALYTPANERMWLEIARRRLAAFLLLGDNVYIDLPGDASPLHDYTYYRRQSRPEFRRLIASTPIYAIWDDHDCATDDVFMGPFVDQPSWKPALWRVFRNNWNNPGYGLPPTTPGCWFKFQIGDVDFFLLDGRYYRTNPLAAEPTMLGPVQKNWLFEGLSSSRATFKVIVSPVAFADAAKSAPDTWRGYPQERAEIFEFLSKHRIEGVVLLSADRHRSDAWRHDRPGDYSLYEFHSSCLTHGKQNFTDVKPESLFGYNEKCSYGMLTFDTAAPDPTVAYEINNIDGATVHRLELKRTELSTAGGKRVNTTAND